MGFKITMPTYTWKWKIGQTICLFMGVLLTMANGAKAAQRDKLNQNQNRFIDISINYKEAKTNDTLTLVIEDILHAAPLLYDLGRYHAVARNGLFTFHVPVKEKCGYFDIIKKRTFTKVFDSEMVMLDSYFWEAGDNVSISLSNKETYAGIYTTCQFKGEGANKYSMRQAIDSLMNMQVAPISKPVFDSTYNYFDIYLSRCTNALKLLENREKVLSSLGHDVLKANLLYGGNKRFQAILAYYKKNIKPLSENQKLVFKKKYFDAFSDNNPFQFKTEVLLNSKNYLGYCFSKYQAQAYIKEDTLDQKTVFNLLKQNFAGSIRDREILILFLHSSKSSHLPELYKQAALFIQDELSVRLLNKLLKTAPDKEFYSFSLKDTKEKNVRLDDFIGKVVLIDFWFNGCGGCATYYQNVLSLIEKKFTADKEVAFVSINIDNEKARWLDGINSDKYTSTNNFNLYTNGEGMNHSLIKSLSVSMFPFVVLLDKKGVIKSLNSSALYQPNELFDAIQSAK